MTRTKQLKRPFGHIILSAMEDPPRLLVQAAGYVGPRLLQDVLAQARAFGAAHPAGWDYIVDTVELKAANPLNIFWLRRVHRLPYLSRYIVVAATTFPVRLLNPLVAWLIRPDLLVTAVQLSHLYDETDAVSPKEKRP